MTTDIPKVGLGFFNKDGVQKTADTIAAEDAATSKPASANDSSSTSDTTVQNALGLVKQRFVSDVNEGISTLNERQDQVSRATDLVKSQLGAARDLSAALKSGDDTGADKAREKLSKLSE